MPKKLVRKITCLRSRQIVVMQGMIHVAPLSFYREVQHELDQMTEQGYQTFFEYVDLQVADKTGFTASEKAIADLLSIILGSYQRLAAGREHAQQGKNIHYPESAIKADMPFVLILRNLRARGFYVSRDVLHLLKSEYFPSLVAEKYNDKDVATNPKLRRYLNQWRAANPGGLVKELLQGLTFERNAYAVDLVESHLATQPEGRVLIHYGNGHLTGMTALFEAHGFRVSEVTFKEI